MFSKWHAGYKFSERSMLEIKVVDLGFGLKKKAFAGYPNVQLRLRLWRMDHSFPLQIFHPVKHIGCRLVLNRGYLRNLFAEKHVVWSKYFVLLP